MLIAFLCQDSIFAVDAMSLGVSNVELLRVLRRIPGIFVNDVWVGCALSVENLVSTNKKISSFVFIFLFALKICLHIFDRRKIPPPGGVSYLAGSLTKNPKEEPPLPKICSRFFEGGFLPPSTWFVNLPHGRSPQ